MCGMWSVNVDGIRVTLIRVERYNVFTGLVNIEFIGVMLIKNDLILDCFDVKD